MKTISLKLFLICALSALSSIITYAQITDRDINGSILLTEHFTRDVVWDAQRWPVYPSAGREWRLSGLRTPLDVSTGTIIDWGRHNDRYLMFSLEAYDAPRGASFIDDVYNSRTKYTVSLNLYESNGRFVKSVSRWGRLIGFGSGGFMYEQEGSLGTFFSTDPLRYGASVTYRPELEKITYLSSILGTNSNNDDDYDGNYDDNTPAFLTSTYSEGQVWNIQRYPVYPSIGREWILSNLKAPLDARTGYYINWGPFHDRYLMFELIEDYSSRSVSLIDETNSGRRYSVALNLFERDGRYVKTISRWGKIMGYGTDGFIYEQEGRYGTFFTTGRPVAGGRFVYRPELSMIRYISEIVHNVSFWGYFSNHDNRPYLDHRPNFNHRPNDSYRPNPSDRRKQIYRPSQGYNPRPDNNSRNVRQDDDKQSPRQGAQDNPRPVIQPNPRRGDDHRAIEPKKSEPKRSTEPEKKNESEKKKGREESGSIYRRR